METQWLHESTRSASTPSVVAVSTTQPPAPPVDVAGDDEVTILSAFSPPALASVTVPDHMLPAGDNSAAPLVFTVDCTPVAATVDAGIAEAVVVDSTTLCVEDTPVVSAADETQSAVVILGEPSLDDFLSAPPSRAATHEHRAEVSAVDGEPEAHGHTDGDDVAEARADALQDKYSATCEWVESLPPSTSAETLPDAVMDASPTSTTPMSATTTAGGKKKRGRGEDASNGGTGARKRLAQEKAVAAELQAAFKHSQRVLRKQGRSVNMRNVFAGPLSLPSSVSPPPHPSAADAESATASGASVTSPSLSRRGGSVFSPLSLVSPSSPSSSSAWSLGLVGELTSRFLANVQQQKRQKCEQMVSRELTQSQALSQTRSLTEPSRQCDDAEAALDGDAGEQRSTRMRAGGAAVNDFATPVDELVIGEEDNEAANWMPADPSSPNSPHVRRMVLRDAGGGDEAVLLGASSSEEGGLPSLSATSVESRRAEAEEASQQQEQVVKALARKHEIWKLRQRQRRAQEQVESDERAKAMQHQQQQASAAKKPASAATSSSVRAAPGEAESAPSPLLSGLLRIAPAAMMDAHALHSGGGGGGPVAGARSIQSAKLSAGDISMIRRLNNFDNTSTQRVVVFGTAASRSAKEESSQQQQQQQH
ncbi:hypothetical protein NESM_000500900 [Novymonas esmeraldas]|uniref:GPI-anchored surface protein n=1 Tax=Novymonas esmeraldas TaxID=1808958 RepID=A0AAW0EPY4_9TRYP